MLYCSKCGKEVTGVERMTGQCHACLSSRTERSGVAQPCPPSAGGSADTLAVALEKAENETGDVENQPADSSVRSADKAIPEALHAWVIEQHNLAIKSFREWNAVEGSGQQTSYRSGMAYAYLRCCREIENRFGTLPAQRERACLPNDKVSYHADNAGGAHGKDTNDK